MSDKACTYCRHDLVAVLSHELRNPLSALSNGLYVLKRFLPEDARSFRAAAVMDRQIRHMTALVDSLSDAANLARGSVQLHLVLVDLVELLRDACLDHEHLFASREVELQDELPPAAPPVLGDPVRLNQVVGNLLRNAALFTPAGGRVVVRLEHDEAGRCARIWVKDSGVGLAEGLRERLFEPFTQADTSLAHTAGGLGLGLAVVKGIVGLHGGSVRAESEGPGQGTTFIVELPYAATEPGSTGP
jgi:signal transduction histidine kinase